MAGELQGTMTTQTPDAQLQALLAALAQQVQGAQGQAQQAGAQYEQAAAEPVPQIGGLAAFLPQLLSNTASTISGNPNYAKQGQQGLQQANENLLEKRKTNLQSMRDKHATLAEHASKLGNVEASAKWSAQVAKTDRELDKIETLRKEGVAKDELAARHTNELKQIEARGQQDRQTSAAKPSATSGPVDAQEVADWAGMLATKQSKIMSVPKHLKTAVVQYMQQNKIQVLPDSAEKAIKALDQAAATVDEIEALTMSLNTAEPGVAAWGQGVRNQLGALTRTNTAAADLRELSGSMATNLARAIASERGTLTDQDRAWARKLIPDEFTPRDLAVSKIARLKRFITRAKENAMTNFTTTDVRQHMKLENPLIQSRELAKAGKSQELKAMMDENPELADDPVLERLIKAKNLQLNSTSSQTAGDPLGIR